MIPEASERDELTVNETSNLKLDFPIEPSLALRPQIADKYLTDFERTEIEEFE